MRVALVEKNHFASGTSGKNSQLIHGGLRYLKYLEFHLVHEALRERATLLRIAGGLVEPLRVSASLLWRVQTAGSTARVSRSTTLLAGKQFDRAHPRESGRNSRSSRNSRADGLRAGLIFHDCKVNSARLVLENILDAEARGAVVANYVEARVDGKIDRGASTRFPASAFTIRARKIVDATGAWSSGAPLRLVRGSHLIFPRIQKGAEAIAYFDEHGRIVFLIPWGEAGRFDPGRHHRYRSPWRVQTTFISRKKNALSHFDRAPAFPGYRGEPISSYSALRPLIAETGHSATSTSREHNIWETADGVLHIAGGKYTTYRAMSEELVDTLLLTSRRGGRIRAGRRRRRSM